jgi:hypothetical protein
MRLQIKENLYVDLEDLYEKVILPRGITTYEEDEENVE